jgi:hypothetical protein
MSPIQKDIVFLVAKTLTDEALLADVCAQTWCNLDWNRGDACKVRVYCYTVNNFRNVFCGLPNFEVTGLLTMDTSYRPFS